MIVAPGKEVEFKIALEMSVQAVLLMGFDAQPEEMREWAYKFAQFAGIAADAFKRAGIVQEAV